MTQGLLKQSPLGRQVAFVVESGVALPADIGVPQKTGRQRGPSSEMAKALSQMEPLQSMLCVNHADYKLATQRLAQLAPKRFISRKTGDGWRVWRLE